MSVEFDRDIQLFTILCDESKCTNEDECEADDFKEGLETMKARGWRVRFESGEYYHTCPSCVKGDPARDFEGV